MDKYFAFISYSRKDNSDPGKEWATWLQKEIESFNVPKELIGTNSDLLEKIPERIAPVFRDTNDLLPSFSLKKALEENLKKSLALIVICSPNSASSKYVAEEIDFFKKYGHGNTIIPVIISGEPNASWSKITRIKGFTSSDECFPEPLQFEYDDYGNLTEKRRDILGVDFRIQIDGQKSEGMTSEAQMSKHLHQKMGYSVDNARNIAVNYMRNLEIEKNKVIATLLGIPISTLLRKNTELESFSKKRELLKSISISAKNLKRGVPFPRKNEKWEVFSTLTTIKEEKDENSPLVFKVIQDLFSNSEKLGPAKILQVSWCQDKLFAQFEYENKKREPRIGHLNEGKGYFSWPYIPKTALGDLTFNKPEDGQKYGYLRNFIPQSADKFNFVLTSTRNLTFWENDDPYCYELLVNGKYKVKSSYKNEVKEIYDSFAKSEKEEWNGDIIHEIGQTVSVSPSGKYIAFRYGILDQTDDQGKRKLVIDLWDYEKRNFTFNRRFQFNDLFSPGSYNPQFKWSPTNRYLVYRIFGGECYLFNIEKSQLSEIISDKYGKIFGNVSWHPSLDILIASVQDEEPSIEGNSHLIFFDVEANKILLKERTDHDKVIQSISYSPDSRYIVTGGEDGILKLWDLTKNEFFHLSWSLGFISKLEFSPDGKRFLCFGGKRISIWDVEKKEQITSFQGNLHEIHGSAWDPSGTKIVYLKDDYTIQVRGLSF